MKRIIIIHHGSHAGGAPISVKNTALVLRERGYIVDVGLVMYSKQNINFYSSYKFKCIDLSSMPRYFYCIGGNPTFYKPTVILERLINFSKFLSKTFIEIIETYDLVYINSITLFPTIHILQKKNIRHIWHIREHSLPNDSFLNKIQKMVLSNSRNKIFLSYSDMKSWDNKGIVIPNWTDWDNIEISSKEKSFLNIMYVGGLNKVKGIDVIIRFVKELEKYKGKVKLTCYGINHEIIYKEKEMYGELFNENVILKEFNPDLKEEYLNSDILLYLSTKPHFSRPIVEAMLSSTLVISSKNESTKEQLINGKYGLFLDKDISESVKQIDSIIDKLLKDSDYYNDTIMKAKNFSAKFYSLSENKKHIYKLINNVFSN